MNAQPEALRLADALDYYPNGNNFVTVVNASAAELRRLHEVNQVLVEALEAIDASAVKDTNCDPHSRTWKAIANARAALAKAKGETE
jgi:hypothetical protein